MSNLMKNFPKKTAWYKWFAWRPIYTRKHEFVWLETVLKRGVCYHGIEDGCSEDVWQYEYDRIIR